MKLLATIAIVILLILTIEARRDDHKDKEGGHHHKRHHKHHGLRDCVNGTCRQPCELRNCDTGKVCVEHTFTCHSDNSVKYISRCRYGQKCNCSKNQICVFNKHDTTCRNMLVNAQPVDTSEPLCPEKDNPRNRSHYGNNRGHHRGGHHGGHQKGRHHGDHQGRGGHHGGHQGGGRHGNHQGGGHHGGHHGGHQGGGHHGGHRGGGRLGRHIQIESMLED